MAKTIYGGIREVATHLISFHTISKLYNAQPYTVAKKVPGADKQVNRTALEMAMAFGVQANCIVDLATATEELPGVTKGALDITCILDGIPAFMGEIGYGGVVDPAMVNVAVQGLKNVMTYLKIIAGTIKVQVPKQYRIVKRKFVRINTGGIIDMKVKPGDIVNAGATVAEIHYFDDNLTPYTVENDAYIIATRTYPAINTGDRVCFLGLEWEECTNKSQ
jgi:predicted deacylase